MESKPSVAQVIAGLVLSLAAQVVVLPLAFVVAGAIIGVVQEPFNGVPASATVSSGASITMPRDVPDTVIAGIVVGIVGFAEAALVLVMSGVARLFRRPGLLRGSVVGAVLSLTLFFIALVGILSSQAP